MFRKEFKIAQVHVKAGEAVKKGQPLMTLLEGSIQESIDKKKGRDPGGFSEDQRYPEPGKH